MTVKSFSFLLLVWHTPKEPSSLLIKPFLFFLPLPLSQLSLLGILDNSCSFVWTVGFNFLMWKEFSDPSTCYFPCSHELCCTHRGGTLHLQPNSLRLYLCRVMLQRIRGIHPMAVSSKIHLQTKAAKGRPFQGSSDSSSLAGRRVLAWPLVMAHVSCDCQELRLGHPRSRLWLGALLWVALVQRRKTALMEMST